MVEPNRSAAAAVGLLLNAFAWGVSWWPFRQLQDLGLHPLWSTALVYCVAVVVLLIVRPTAWRSFQKTAALWVLLVAAGLTNVGFNWAVTIGDVVRVVLLFYLMPAWVVVLAWPLLGERPTRSSLAQLLLALAGVLVILKTPEAPWPIPHTLADGLALLGGFAFALTNVMLRKLHSTPQASSMLAMFGGGALLSALVAWGGARQGIVSTLPPPNGAWIAGVVALSAFFLVGNVGLQYGASRLRASTTSIIMLSEVVFASGSAVLLGASTLSVRTVLGAAMILLAAVLSARKTPP